MKKKVVFFGTPEHASQILHHLYANQNIEIVAVVTNPDRPVGRKKVLTPSSVKSFAISKNIPVLQPLQFRQDEKKILESYHADFFIIVAYGTLIPQSIIDIPKVGTFNLHFSLLPKYRGASPVQAALCNGDKISGITVFRLVEAMDAGDIYIQENINIEEENFIGAIEKMTTIGAQKCEDICLHFDDYSPLPQGEKEATYCSKITKADGEVFPHTQSATDIIRKFRGFYLWPGVFSIQSNGKRIMWKELRIVRDEEQKNIPAHEAGTFFIFEKRAYIQSNTGTLEVLMAQREGKKVCKGKVLGDVKL